KLLYYAQGMYLSQPREQGFDVLFEDTIRAWKHGPVVPGIYRRFSKYVFNEIDKKEINHGSIRAIEENKLDVFLDKVWTKYGAYNGKQLERMSHMEEPWKNTRGNLPSYVSSNAEIPIHLIKEYFSKKE